MKFIYFILIISLINLSANAQEFITTWSKSYAVTELEFEATTTGPVSYTWETLPPAAAASGSGTFQGPDVVISGLPSTDDSIDILLKIQPQNFKSIKTTGGGFGLTSIITEVNQWGNVSWESMENAFNNFNFFLVSATDIPDLSNVTSMKNMFAGCQTLNSPFNINFWDISNVTNLSGMFKNCGSFNQALSQWDTSNVTDMSSMFEGAFSFNQNIGTWDTSNVTDMSKMFKEAPSFDNNIGNWDTSNVTNMSEMFSNDLNSGFEYQFNVNISGWNTSNVTDMSGTFKGAKLFDQPIGNWDTSNVTDMSEMFNTATAFDQDISNWDTSNVTNMSKMFYNNPSSLNEETLAFNNDGSPLINNWDTSNVTNFSEMFFRAENFEHELSNWSLAQAQDLTGMLDESGLDCNRYSATLIGWNNDPDTPNDLLLGAALLKYKSEALPAINDLLFNKGWSISGHDIVSTIPAFNIDNTYCQGEPEPTLPDVSIEGINGSWSPDFDPTQTTTYTFTPDPNECALDTSFTINVLDGVSEPSGNSSQTLSAGATISDLVISPSSVLWYATEQDALNDVNTLTDNFPLEDGATYYAVNDNGQCRSHAFPVSVQLTLSIADIEKVDIEHFPNPVRSHLKVTSDQMIGEIRIYDMRGKLLLKKTYQDTDVQVDMGSFTSAVYIVQLRTAGQIGHFKVVKK